MAEINLLKQNNRSEGVSDIFASVVVKVLVVVIIVLAGYYVWVFIQIRGVNAQSAQAERNIESANQTISSVTGKDELVTRQQQLKELSQIVANHPYWSEFVSELARVTLKNASYTSVKVLNNGTLTLTAQVPTLEDLDKFLQVFDYPVFNQNFSDLHISSIGTHQEGSTVVYQFDVQMKYDTSLLRYSAQPKQ